MAEHTIQNWIKTALKEMKFPPDRDKVRQELWDHLLDSRDYRVERGMDLKEAEEAAVIAMGDPKETGRRLNKVHRPWLGWVWTVSRLVLLVVCLYCYNVVCMNPEVFLDQPDLRGWGCRQECGYPPFEYWADPPEVERTAILPGAVERAGVYTLTLDHGSWVTAEDQQWVVLCFRVRAERIWDLDPYGIFKMVEAEDDLDTQFRDVHLGGSMPTWFRRNLRSPYLHLMLTIPDGESRQWVRFYVPGTDFDITVDREGRVLPWPKRED